MNSPPRLGAIALVAALIFASAAIADVPRQMSYQVMLTDDADNPLVEENVEIVFELYNSASRGRALWSETHNIQTNSIGVVSVILGKTTLLSLVNFDQPLWLEITVDGVTMTPRRELSTAPYAVNASELGGAAAAAYLLETEAAVPGAINTPGNPLEWTKLKGVPAGIADGVDNTGPGDGHSLDASDGSPTDVVHVDADGVTRVGPGAHGPYPQLPTFRVAADRNQSAGAFEADGHMNDRPAVYARSDSSTAIVANANMASGAMAYYSGSAGVVGMADGSGRGGHFYAWGSGTGVYAGSAGGTALEAAAYSNHYSGRFSGGVGVRMTRDGGYPVLQVENHRTSLDADAAWFSSESGVSSTTWTLNSTCHEGNAGRFHKATDDGQYAVRIWGANSTSEGLYVQGTVYSTSLLARGVETSRGTEPVFGVASADVELMDSGRAALARGVARVEFDDTFAESIAGAGQVTVSVTPVGGWSGVYVRGIDRDGFDVVSEVGDPEVAFHWVAIGRARGHERAPEITIPDPEEDTRVAAEKMAILEASRPPRKEPTETNLRITR